MEIVASMSEKQSLDQESSNACTGNSDSLPPRRVNHTREIEKNKSPNMPPSECTSKMCTSPIQPPNTDNLLDISVPKITLLGKEQAKKRLYAFSMSKQSMSPTCKRSKSKCDEKSESEKIEPSKKQKRGLNPNEKAKAVIEEIEEIKKIEHAYYEAMEQGMLDTRKEWKRRHRKERRRSVSSDNVHPKSWERERYPESWCEIKERGYDQETLTDMKLEFLKRFDECLDYRKQFLFETPSLLLHPFVYKDIAGKERIIPVLSRRITKTRPKISFSVTEKVEYSTTYNRKYVLEYVPKLFKEHILKIIACSSRPSEAVSSKPATRRWFPKIVFNNVERETECRVLENSLGLSFLQNYSDEEEQDKDDTKPIETKSANKRKEISRRKTSKDDTRKRKKKNKAKKNKKCKGKKVKSKKLKHTNTQKEKIHEEIDWVERIEVKPPKADKCVAKDSKYKKNSDKEIERNKTKKAKKIDEKNSFHKTVDIQNEQSKKSQCVEVTDKKTNNKHTFIQQSYLQKPDNLDKKEEKERKSKEEPYIDSVSKKNDMCVKSKQLSTTKSSARIKKDQLLEDESKKEVEDIEGDIKCTTGEELDTPDTDEYYSNWESEDELLNSSTSKQSDLYTDTSGVNVSWESDTDIPLSKSPVREFYQSPHEEVSDFSPFRNRFINERRRSRCSLDNPSPPFLEMPLNIRNYRKIQWQEERHNTEHINFRLQNDQKSYSLYTEDSWEKDDYMTIKNEELRLEEERRTLMEERRQLEIEKKKLEELERERYYFHRSNDEKYNELYVNSDNRYHHKNYRYHRDGEFEKTSRKSSLEEAPQSVDAAVEVVRHIEKKPPAVSRKHRKSKWQNIDVNELEIKNVHSSKQEIKENSQCPKDMFSGKHSSPNKIEVQKPEVLETEYEKFMKALGSQTAKEKEPSENKHKNVSKKRLKKSKSSSSSSSSSSSCDSDSSSTTSVTSSSSSSSKKRRKQRNKCVVLKKVNTHSPIKKIENKQVIKIEDVERDLFEKEGEILAIQLPQLEISEHKTIPLPVPSPKVDSAVLNVTPSIPDIISVVVPTITVSPIKAEEKVECKELTPKKNNIIPIKFLTPELRRLAYDTTHANEIGDITISSPVEMKTEHQNYSQTGSPLMNMSTKINDFNLDDKTLLKNEEEVTTSECTEVAGSISQEVHTDKLDFKEVIQNNNLTITKRDTSSSLKRKDEDLLIRNEETKQSRDSPVKHNVSSKRKKERKDSENVSPVSEINRKLSSNQFNHFSINKCTKTEKENLQRISSVEKCSNLSKASPLSSPLDGFKRSVADSTISDEQLLQSNLVECIESPNIYKNPAERSPRRMSLDERINQALGRAEEPKPITTTYSNNCNYEPQYFEECFDSYVDEPKKSPILNKQDQHSARENSKLKVLQVGNILQVVPTEDYSEISIPPKKKTPLQQNKISNSTQKILQVGNMLQIVPTTTSFPENFEMESENSAPPVPSTSTPVKNTFNAEILVKQKAERRAEKDKRKQERQLKRKEKEKKRKERERRKQLKVKLQTEAMIKQALILEDANVVDEQHLSEPQKPAQWPPIPQIVSNSAYRPPGKGILSQRKEEREEILDKRKQVQFSDGIKPGEGTSPSGGEDLSSPPPAARKLPKEKRFRKIKPPKKEKVPKKKKVKVKVIRQQAHYDDESEEDTLPPPPPPPGSPPPHLFPARIKEPIFNNIHSNILASITNTPIQTPDTSYPPPVFRPSAPVVIPHHIPLHPPGPPPQVHRHHLPPPLPTSVLHHGGFNQSTNIIPHGNHR